MPKAVQNVVMADPIREHLKTLSIFHYVVGGMGYLFSLFPLFHLAMGILILVSPEVPPSDEVPLRMVGTIFVVFPALMIVGGFVLSTLVVLAGRRLAALRSHTFCLVVAGIECIFMPFGPILGVFSILALVKPETKRLFGAETDPV